MSKVCTVAIIGCGGRGSGYGKRMNANPEKYNVVSICDPRTDRLDRYGKQFGVAEDMLFTDDKEFFKERRADILVIGTQDRQHVDMACKALELGYHILLEKPISPIKDELYQLLDTHKKHPQNVVVCHVLRYAPGFVKIKEILESGEIGQLRVIEWTEQVAYWHQSHSFVRGNWRRDDETSPMIMQKCCHDLDLLQYYVGSRCESVYSTGELSFFKAENQPEGASDRCADCKFIKTCPYSAEHHYIDRWYQRGAKAEDWPFDVVCSDFPLTEEKIRKAYQSNQYGQCVFKCDNNVVDNQTISIKFENGVKVNMLMTGFTADPSRKATFYGTMGEIRFNDIEDYIDVVKFGKAPVRYKISDLVENAHAGYGHGGGDAVMVDSLYEMIVNPNAKIQTSLEASVESHLMALCAEESRKSGKVVKIHQENN